ncbi:1-acyl-sn-glycerol-3-phosphate acyltransferase [Desulfopila sp. IMCC35006]|uniref:lysophospholipid acyltransferase family protein n=1 Tax=Desulfopila sp. IMCC35006 TaxID=2569542 RepID=UPI0010AC667C|nr:lysophospholipid acyltransferase family protein [Desulfopila sp. IMCC35006]TKB28239.1 1-acyl-sn-glycerol-3-phosphate acyltransferase [Desulfopila sp. IMCC35006]
MEATQARNNHLGRWLDRCIDCWATLTCWAWFIFGYFLFFSWRYGAAAFSAKQQARFQEITNQFYKIFFKIVRVTAPGHRILIDDEVAAIRSAVIVCNHLSYLDPLLMIALFQHHKTIVKSRFFGMPIFGWIMRKSGYLPATSEGRFSNMMIEQMEQMPAFLASGGNLFVFPEGTRSRDGKLGPLNRGAFKIARMCRAPIYVLQIQNTDKLFTPGRFLFNTRIKNTISVKIIDRIRPDYGHDRPSAAQLEQRVQQAYARMEA